MNGWTIVLLSPQDVISSRTVPSMNENPAYGLALLISGRIRQFSRFMRNESQSADGSADAHLRQTDLQLLHAASRAFMDSESLQGAAELQAISRESENDSEIRLAAGVLASVAYAESGHEQKSLDVIMSLVGDCYSWPPLMRAVIFLHASLRLAESNEFEQAEEFCYRARTALQTDPIYFEIPLATSSEEARALIDEISGGLAVSVEENSQNLRSIQVDKVKLPTLERRTPTNFWLRKETLVSSTARHIIRESFEERIRDSWSRGKPYRINFIDEVSANLYFYSVQCQISGNWPRSRMAAELLGRERMLRPIIDEDETGNSSYKEGLSLLRKSGNSEAYGQAVRKVREEGPLEVLQVELRNVLDRLHDGFSKTDLVALRWGAPVLLPHQADAAVHSLLEREVKRIQPTASGWYSVTEPLWDAVAALAREVSDPEYVARQLRIRLEGVRETEAHDMASVVENLDWKMISPDEQLRWIELAKRAESATDALTETLLEELGKLGNKSAVDVLDLSIMQNMTLSKAATAINLYAAGQTALLDKHGMRVLDFTRSAMAALRSEASHGSYAFGGVNPAVVAAAVSCLWSQGEIWHDLTEFVLDGKVAEYQKNPVFDILSRNAERVPFEVSDRINRSSRVKPVIIESFPGEMEGSRMGASLRFACAFGVARPIDILNELIAMFSDERPARRIEAARSIPAAASVIKEEILFGLLCRASVDENVLVRSAAAAALGFLAAREGDMSRYAAEQLGPLLATDGVAVPFGVLRGLREYGRPRQLDATQIIRAQLVDVAEDHPVSRVRKVAAELSSQWGPSVKF